MPIPMQVPAQFIQAVLDGTARRYGCIIKDAATGRILGHLKEVGTWSNTASSVPLNPLTTAVQIGQWLDTRSQLGAIRQTLSQLQMISSVGAVASVAGLGVSVAGFAVVLRRLDRLEANVGAAMGKIQAEVEKVRIKLDMLEMAEIRAAWEQLAGARQSADASRPGELLKAADQTFQKYRNYYYSLLREVRPMERSEVPVAAVRELYGRLFACGQAELEANLLLGDFEHWYFRHERISAQLVEVCTIQPTAVFRARADAGGLLTSTELGELQGEIVMTRDFCAESLARVMTADQEVRWLEAQGTAPEDYLAILRQAPDVGIVMVPHAERSSSDRA